jgi:hypothetical protein
MIDIFHRLPINDALRSYVKDILSSMFKLLSKENEENTLLLLRIIVEYMKYFRPQMINEVREFLQFVHNIYRQKTLPSDQLFLTRSFNFDTMTLQEVNTLTIAEQIHSSVQITVKKNSTSDETTTNVAQVQLEHVSVDRRVDLSACAASPF